MELCPCEKKKERTEEERRSLCNRLSRIEGQVRGLKDMVERNAYCPDILVQVSAVSAALDSFSRQLLSGHIRTCVAEGIRRGEEDVVDELLSLLGKLMK